MKVFAGTVHEWKQMVRQRSWLLPGYLSVILFQLSTPPIKLALSADMTNTPFQITCTKQPAHSVNILEGVFLLLGCCLFTLNIKVLDEIRHVVIIILSGTGRWPLLPLLDGLV